MALTRSRADLARVGLFVVVAGAILVAGLLWIAGGRLFRGVATYTILFKDSVSGLNSGANVEYQGVVVGRVRDVRLTRDIPPQVAVIVDLEPGTPVRSDTTAALLGSLVTGIKFVQLQGGTEGAGELEPGGTIRGDVTSLEQFRDQMSDVADRVSRVLKRLDEKIFTDENGAAMGAVVKNLGEVTEKLNVALGTFTSEGTSQDVANLVRRVTEISENVGRIVSDFEKRRDSIYGNLESVVRHIDEMAVATKQLAEAATSQIGSGGTPVGTLLGDLNRATNRLQETLDVIQSDPSLLLRGRQIPEREFER